MLPQSTHTDFGVSRQVELMPNKKHQKQDATTHTHNWVVVSNIFYVYHGLAKWSNLTNIFQIGWNHQVDNFNLATNSSEPLKEDVTFQYTGCLIRIPVRGYYNPYITGQSNPVYTLNNQVFLIAQVNRHYQWDWIILDRRWSLSK